MKILPIEKKFKMPYIIEVTITWYRIWVTYAFFGVWMYHRFPDLELKLLLREYQPEPMMLHEELLLRDLVPLWKWSFLVSIYLIMMQIIFQSTSSTICLLELIYDYKTFYRKHHWRLLTSNRIVFRHAFDFVLILNFFDSHLNLFL